MLVEHIAKGSNPFTFANTVWILVFPNRNHNPVYVGSIPTTVTKFMQKDVRVWLMKIDLKSIMPLRVSGVQIPLLLPILFNMQGGIVV